MTENVSIFKKGAKLEDELIATENYVDTLHSQVTQQLAETATDLQERGLNASSRGATGSGIVSDSTAIQLGIDELYANGGGVLILTGKHLITSTIILKSGVSLKFENEAEIIINTNIKGISFDRNTNVYGKLKVTVTLTTYSEDILYFDGSKALSYRDITIDDVFIIGDRNNGQGNAIRLDCTKVGSNISFLNIGHGVIRGFNKGIFIDVPNLNENTIHNYANSNRFNNFELSDCTYLIYVTGGRETKNEASGNQFPNLNLQWNTRCLEMIHCEGTYNKFNAMAWDAAKKGTKVINFTSKSAANSVYINKHPDSDYVDLGSDNFISFRDYNLFRYEDIIPIKNRIKPTITYDMMGVYGRFNGDYEDILHGSDKLHTVEIEQGVSFLVGGAPAISRIFNGQTSKYATLLLGETDVFKFKITFKPNNYNGFTDAFMTGGLSKLALIFQSDRTPKNIVIDLTTDTDVVHSHNLVPVLGDGKVAYSLDFNNAGMANALKSVTVTLTGSNDTDVRLSRIVAKSLHVGGNRYLSNTGDNVVGDLTFLSSSDGIVLKSPNGTKYKLSVSDAGAPVFTAIT